MENSSFTVVEIAELFRTNPETVRRWVRSGKLIATQSSRKEGNLISDRSLKSFIDSKPKYREIAMTSFMTVLPLASAILFATTMGVLNGLIENIKTTDKDIIYILESEIEKSYQKINHNNEKISTLKKEIDDENQKIISNKRVIEYLKKKG